MNLKPGKILENLKEKAAAVVEDRAKFDQLLSKAKEKVSTQEGLFQEVIEDFKTCLRMLTAYAKGRYKVPWPALLASAAAVIYFVNPFDLIPDFLVGTGLIDDGAVIAFMLASIRTTVREFSTWEQTQTNAEDAEIIDQEAEVIIPPQPYDPDL